MAVTCAGLLAGCGGVPPAPVSERTPAARAAQPSPVSKARTVKAGDTLYSIAWEAGLDYRELARWNGIPPPYRIKPGQQLRLQPIPVKKPVPDKPATVTRPGSTDNTAVVREPETSGPVRWIWPTNGPILRTYSEKAGNKGLDIGGQTGQEVRAAAAGRVVYQGSGLRGYGELIIIKHNESFLSAYAHNEKAFVREGDQVRRGQKIAAMGASGTDRVKLHFEIRQRGTPVDPLQYLPRR